MANTYLSRTPSGAGNRKTFTLSTWFKTAGGTSGEHIFQAYSAGSDYMAIIMSGSDLIVKEEASSSAAYFLQTDRKFRDTSGWYHLMVVYNSTESTTADRIKIYINGVQETSFSSAAYPTQNLDSIVNSTVIHTIGASGTGAEFWNGSMSHFHFCDGTALAPTVFGETDATTGEWKIKTSPSFTPGTNGFTILKDGNTITDQSANSNNFALAGGTLTNTEDCPSNVFATIDQAYYINRAQSVTLSSGNTKVVSSGNNWKNFVSTLTMGSGKYYCEYKVDAWNGSNLQFVGVVADWLNLNKSSHPDSFAGNATNGIGYAMNGNYTYNNSDTSGGASYAANDIIGVALDATNSKLYFSKNGSWQFSGDPSNNSGGISIAANLNYFFVFGHYGSQGGSFNFGNGYFGTTAISSEGTNASGIGKFEYDVPTGFAALSTKGLNN